MKQKTAFFVVFFSAVIGYSQHVYQKQFVKMGSDFELTVVAENEKEARVFFALGMNEIDRIEALISSWQPQSETSKVNQNAGKKGTVVSRELFELVKRAKAISKLTDGAFDITYASVDKLWKFDGRAIKKPSSEKLNASVKNIGFEKIELEEEKSALFLTQSGMKMGFGAIGKGYAADAVKRLLQAKGVKAGIVNASGDMSAWGKNPNGEDWQIGLVNPMNKNKVFSWFSLNEKAVVTSGDYERYVMIDGERYGHIINPKTGMPSKGIVSATVFAPKAELADALATALFVMGVETGMNMIDQLPQIEALVITTTGEIVTSKNIEQDAYL